MFPVLVCILNPYISTTNISGTPIDNVFKLKFLTTYTNGDEQTDNMQHCYLFAFAL